MPEPENRDGQRIASREVVGERPSDSQQPRRLLHAHRERPCSGRISGLRHRQEIVQAVLKYVAEFARISNMDELTAEETFRRRAREAREKAGLSQQDVVDRLVAIGYVDGVTDAGEPKPRLSRAAIAEIEREGGRRIRLDDALAIAAALGIAPVHLIVPFEDPEPIDLTYRVKDRESGAIREETPADHGLFNPTAKLKIGDKLSLAPSEARPWIRGQSLYVDALGNAELEARFYYEEVPPPRRYQLDEWIEAIQAGRRPKVKLAEDVVGKRVARWPREALQAIPTPMLAAMLAKEMKEEEAHE
jgi:transcriptional regulator with XRE-family HTH domain